MGKLKIYPSSGRNVCSSSERIAQYVEWHSSQDLQVSFWISRDSAPSRTIIGVMTVLTETHLMTGTNRRLPPVAYVKAVDVYLGFCYLLVVLALIEYACVAYSKVGRVAENVYSGLCLSTATKGSSCCHHVYAVEKWHSWSSPL